MPSTFMARAPGAQQKPSETFAQHAACSAHGHTASHLDLRILALIPARGGSKGLKGKNIKELDGRPLIARSIDAALQARLVDRVVVSTDCLAIRKQAASLGAETPFLRPANLARDDSGIGDMLQHALEQLSQSGYSPDAVLILQPTSPFIPAGLVDTAAEKLREGYQSFRTVRRCRLHDLELLRISKDGSAQMLRLDARTTDFYRPYGLLSGHRLACTSSRGIYTHVLDNPAELIDIDELEDLKVARAVVAQGLCGYGTQETTTRKDYEVLHGS